MNKKFLYFVALILIGCGIGKYYNDISYLFLFIGISFIISLILNYLNENYIGL